MNITGMRPTDKTFNGQKIVELKVSDKWKQFIDDGNGNLSVFLDLGTDLAINKTIKRTIAGVETTIPTFTETKKLYHLIDDNTAISVHIGNDTDGKQVYKIAAWKYSTVHGWYISSDVQFNAEVLQKVSEMVAAI